MTDLFEKSIETLELPRVLDLLADQAVTQEGKERARRLRPHDRPGRGGPAAERDHRRRGPMMVLRGSPSFSGVKPVAGLPPAGGHGGQPQHPGAAGHRRRAALPPGLPRTTAESEEEKKTCIDHLFRALTRQPLPGGQDHRLHPVGGRRSGRLRQPGAGLHPPAHAGHGAPRCGTSCSSSSPPPSPSTSRRPSSPMRSGRYVVPVKSEYKNDDPRPGPRRVRLRLHLLHRAHGGGEGQQRAAGAPGPGGEGDRPHPGRALRRMRPPSRRTSPRTTTCSSGWTPSLPGASCLCAWAPCEPALSRKQHLSCAGPATPCWTPRPRWPTTWAWGRPSTPW